jgi:hypothetical protein
VKTGSVADGEQVDICPVNHLAHIMYVLWINGFYNLSVNIILTNPVFIETCTIYDLHYVDVSWAMVFLFPPFAFKSCNKSFPNSVSHPVPRSLSQMYFHLIWYCNQPAVYVWSRSASTTCSAGFSWRITYIWLLVFCPFFGIPYAIQCCRDGTCF